MSLLDLLISEQRALSVGELTSQIRELLEVEFFDVWVEGEVSNFKRHGSGHWYFTLKDRDSPAIEPAHLLTQKHKIRLRRTSSFIRNIHDS